MEHLMTIFLAGMMTGLCFGAIGGMYFIVHIDKFYGVNNITGETCKCMKKEE